jgi:serine/threonine-protein kinase HipA
MRRDRGGKHYLDVEGEGRNPTRAHVLKLGARHSLNAKAVAAILDQVRAAVARWSAFAGAVGVTKASEREIESAHERVWATSDV